MVIQKPWLCTNWIHGWCCEKYDIHSYFSLLINADLFPSYSSGRRIVNKKVYKYDKENLLSYASEPSNLTVSIFWSLPPHSFWSIICSFLDLVPKFRNQVRLFSVNLNYDSKCRRLLGGLNIPFPKVIKDTGNMLQFQCPIQSMLEMIFFSILLIFVFIL